MDIHVLRNFLEIARDENMTAAAGRLHLSQSTLSMQMKRLEEEMGTKLFNRHSRNVSLTESGVVLRDRVSDILAIYDRTAEEFHAAGEESSEIHVGCGASFLLKDLAAAFAELRAGHPRVRFNLISGDRTQILERLDRGILDFALVAGPLRLERYDYREIPIEDTWGVVMRKDHPLARKKCLTFVDLKGENLITSEQSLRVDLPRWTREKLDELRFAGFANMSYNSSVFVREGLGIMLTYERLIEYGEHSELCFRPLKPGMTIKTYVIWKKNQVFSPVTEQFIEQFLGRVC